MTLGIKICGINSESALQAVVEAGCDYLGFIFYPPSPRHVSFEQATHLRALVPSHVKTVAVTVNADNEIIDEIITHVGVDMLQLHGRETPEHLSEIKALYPHIPLIKALPVRKGEDILASEAYARSADMFLFDAPPPPNSTLPGGNGISFDWNMLKSMRLPRPWFLSGGLNPENVQAALQASGAQLVDVSSGVESAPGVKDNARIHAFIKAAHGE